MNETPLRNQRGIKKMIPLFFRGKPRGMHPLRGSNLLKMLLDEPKHVKCPSHRTGDKVFRGCYSWRHTWLNYTYLILD